MIHQVTVVRRRLQACYWKQWRRPRNRIHNPVAIGRPPLGNAHTWNQTQDPWVMSWRQAVHAALSNAYLAAQGLASVKEIWTKLASKQRTAYCGLE